MPIEKRRAERKPVTVTLPVWIDRGDGSPWEGAALQDVSETGARLKLLSADATVPQRFLLRLSLRDLKGKPCLLRWRRGEAAGVEYLRPRSS